MSSGSCARRRTPLGLTCALLLAAAVVACDTSRPRAGAPSDTASGAQSANEPSKTPVQATARDAGPLRDAQAPPNPMAGRDGSLGSDVVSTEFECHVGGRVCRWAPWDHIEFAIDETPEHKEDFEDERGFFTRKFDVVPDSRTLSAEQVNDGLGGYLTKWYTSFEFDSDRPSKGSFWFANLKPYGVLQAPTPLHYRGTRENSVNCAADGDDPDARIVSVQDSMRNENGELLFARGVTPIRYDGSVMLSPGDLSEFSMRWASAGCEACGKGWFTVALELKVLDSGATMSILPGERANFQMRGHEYVFMSQQTGRPALPDRCGDCFWTIYRTDFWLELNEDGSAPKQDGAVQKLLPNLIPFRAGPAAGRRSPL